MHKVGIVGIGQMAAEVHLPVLAAMDDVEIVWLADPDQERARAVARAFGYRNISFPTDAIELPPADSVLIAAPWGVRPKYYSALAKNGTAVYVEKPLARSLEEHDRYAALFPAWKFAVGYQRRSAGYTNKLAAIIHTRVFGNLRRVRAELGSPGIVTSGRYSTNLEMAGGGLLFDVGVNAIDLVLFVSRASDIRTVNGAMELKLGFDIHTDACAIMVCPNEQEVPFELLVSNLCHASGDLEFEFDHATVKVAPFGSGEIRVYPRDEIRDAQDFSAGHGSRSIASAGASKARACDKAMFHLSTLDDSDPRTSFQMVHSHWRTFFQAQRDKTLTLVAAETTRVTTALIERLYALGEG